MIRSLRRRFLMIAMCSLLGTMAVLCAAIGAGTYYVFASRADRAIDLLYQNGGAFPQPEGEADPSAAFHFQVTPETPFETRYFIVALTENQEVKSVDTDHIAALDRHTVVDSINRIVSGGKARGYVDYYRYKLFQEADGSSVVIVLDCFLQMQAAYNILRITLLVFLSCALIVFALLLVFSKRAIRPFVENLERQRQFVTDASHELKTPLAILSANMGLLADSCGQNQWLESARAQISRLDRLIRNLVELARTEETIREEAVVRFSVSEIARASADAFQPLAESGGRNLRAEIAGEVYLRGVQDNFFRLFAILLDNAVKYCDPGGTVRFSLSLRGRNLWITVSNPCEGLDPALLPRYFDRFYRADSSRARETGGYGIGLSTAKAIVTRHRGHISNRYANGTITFSAVIPQAEQRRAYAAPPGAPGRPGGERFV